VRVIAGRLGGRRLRAPAGSDTRPTAERVREALFSMLGPLDGATVLDLFAGSGALGIEALSRGAERAVFVELRAAALRTLRANLSGLGLEREDAEVRRADVLDALRSARTRRETYDLVFIDPPYRRAAGWGSELSTALPPLLAPAARVVTESDRRSPLPLTLAIDQERRYGDTLIRIHTRP
jgi:16S rRNA (guanine966-N2)-methyltransferase